MHLKKVMSFVSIASNGGPGPAQTGGNSIKIRLKQEQSMELIAFYELGRLLHQASSC